MAAWFTSGRAIDLILAIVGLEVLALLLWRGSRRFAPLGPIDLIGQLAAGAFLLVAVRCALTGAAWWWTALWLTASFPAHVFDLWRRTQRRPA